jgi:hypothetical protein
VTENGEENSKTVSAPSAEAAHGQMMSMITGFWVSQIVHAAAVFRLADHVHDGVTRPDDIARLESADPDAVRRLMRTCASLGLLRSDDGVRYAATDLLSTLRADHPASLRALAVSQASPGVWRPWGLLTDAIRTGRSQTSEALGMDLFTYYEQHLDEAGAFSASMANMSVFVHAEVTRALDTSDSRVAVDVGGARGELVQSLMGANPGLRGVVLDKEHVVPAALSAAESAGLADRFSAVGGDFFESVPKGDLLLLKSVLHDWEDERAVQILTSCAAALVPGGRVVIVEHLLGEVGEPGFAPLQDINMLTLVNGRERGLAAFDALLAAAGLRRTKVTPAGGMAIIEAVAATS